MVKFAGRNISGKSLCKGIRDTWIKKGVHAVVLKGRAQESCQVWGTEEGLKKAAFSWCLRTLQATRFSKFAQEKADLMELSYRMCLTVQFISRITTKLCDLWPLLPKMNNPTPGLWLLSRSNSIPFNKYLLSACYVKGTTNPGKEK